MRRRRNLWQTCNLVRRVVLRMLDLPMIDIA